MNEYYIYELYDSLKPFTPFYIGKGKGNRMYKHQKMAIDRKHYNKYLQNKILKVLREGNQVVCNKLAEGLTDKEALDMETRIVKELKYQVELELCNLTDGGEGLSGHKHSDKSKEQSSISNIKRWTDELRTKSSMHAKQSIAHKIARDKNREIQKKKVIRISDNTIYDSISDCARDNNCSIGLVSLHCSGKIKNIKYKNLMR